MIGPLKLLNAADDGPDDQFFADRSLVLNIPPDLSRPGKYQEVFSWLDSEEINIERRFCIQKAPALPVIFYRFDTVEDAVHFKLRWF